MAYLTTAAHRLHYQTFGSAAQPPLLILHGFLGSWRDFSSVLPQLKAHFYCILPDLPGHGKTTTTSESGYSFSHTARSLISLLTYLNIKQTNLLGYSMGGRIALYVACHYPTHISRVILESASPGLRTDAERKARKEKDEAIAQQIETLPLSDFLTHWYKNPLFASLEHHPQASADMLKRRQKNEPTELIKALRGLGTGQQPSVWNCLRNEKRPPLMLMFGSQDLKFVALSQEMAKECEKSNKPEVVLRSFSGCGHNIHLEAGETSPKQYADAVSAFLLGHIKK